MDRFEFNDFVYIENLDVRSFNLFPESLRLDQRPTSESLLFRLLLGTLSLKNDEVNQSIDQKITYTKIRDHFSDNDSNNPIRDWLLPDYGITDLDYYFKVNNKKNKAIFDELLTEFSLYFINKHRKHHVEAFLNLYRALEYISYSFPMIFSSMSTNYYNTYDTFKTFFTNKEDGQLKFFSKFLNVIFEDFTLRCPVKIDTYSFDDILGKKNHFIIQKLCNDFEYSDNGSMITITYKNLLDFMIGLRNSYFHFMSDRKNNISNIIFNGDIFFSGLNDKFANWLSMIYQEILKHGIYKLNLLPVT